MPIGNRGTFLLDGDRPVYLVLVRSRDGEALLSPFGARSPEQEAELNRMCRNVADLQARGLLRYPELPKGSKGFCEQDTLQWSRDERDPAST